jgi:hypothetical protein
MIGITTDGSASSSRPPAYPAGMTDRPTLGRESGDKKTFLWVIDWPGWCRAGKDPDLALEALLAHAPRYAKVAERAGLDLPALGDGTDLEVVAGASGGGGTDFGVPSEIVDDDRRPVSAAQAKRLASLVAAAWAELDAIAERTPATLRKGPRGGGRDRDKMLGHVIEADHAYAREIGVKVPAGSLEDLAAVRAERAAMLEVLSTASDGSPLAGRRWTLRYAARRIAWHALDHAWEMEDRTEA